MNLSYKDISKTNSLYDENASVVVVVAAAVVLIVAVVVAVIVVVEVVEVVTGFPDVVVLDKIVVVAVLGPML